MNIENLINSKEYKCKLSEHLTSLLIKTKSAKNEATTSDAFEKEIYYFIRSFFDIDVLFNKEVGQSTLRHKFVGRMDAVCNKLVIEYKQPGKLDKDKDKSKALEQLSNYLIQLLEEDNSEYYGILTDGIKIQYVYFQNAKIHSTSFKNIDENDLDKLVQSLIDISNKKFVPRNIVEDFKINSINGVTKKLAQFLYKSLINKKSDKTSMLFQEWEVLFHLSESDKGQNEDIKKRRKALSKLFMVNIDDIESDYKALFALQTTYAIIVKLIACKVITKIEFSTNIGYFSDLTSINFDNLREFLAYIEDGYVFQTGGVRNLLEGDFFSWYCSTDIWSDEEAKIILDLINLLEGYSISFYRHGYTTIDIFIDLYMEIMPQEVRHSLGEYFTPAWLADYVVNKSIESVKNDEFNAIDPCCGSGVFIMSLIKHIIGKVDIISLNEKEKKTLLNSILQRIKGVDINPLSVLTAKVCFYLSIKPLINGDDIEIPIYLGDSANIPNKKYIDDIECYHYTVNTKQENIEVSLPSAFVESNEFLTFMSQIQSIIKTEDPELVYHKFMSFLHKDIINNNIQASIKNLSSQLARLHSKNWDGIWIRIVANFMLVARIKNIDIIVGNPPWIKWEFLPQAYAQKIKDVCIDRHLFSGQSYMGAISLNICALIANVTASSWLKKDGILAFLMPQTLMTQDSYAGFRNFFTNVKDNERMYLQNLDDWTKSGNPFIDTQEKFMTYYYKNTKVDYFNDGIPITAFQKKRGVSIRQINEKQSFNEVETYFNKEVMKAFQMDKERTGYTTFEKDIIKYKSDFDSIIGESYYKARSGVEFTPAEVYFVEPIQTVSSDNSFLFKASEFKNSKYKSLTNLPMQLETKFIKPVVKAPYIIPFGIQENNNYCIFPYEDGISISIESKDLMLKSPNLFNYLTTNKKLIEKQSKRSKNISRGDAFYSLSKVGDYTYSPYKVAFRDNTKLAATVISKKLTPWGEYIMPICAKHCPYISKDKTGQDITEDEAHFLCGILNTTIVQQYFKFTYSTRSYSINFNIKMPKYDEKNKLHYNIMKLSKEATANGISDKLIKDLNNTYIELCKSI